MPHLRYDPRDGGGGARGETRNGGSGRKGTANGKGVAAEHRVRGREEEAVVVGAVGAGAAMGGRMGSRGRGAS